MKFAEKIDIGNALLDWLNTLDPIADCRVKETDRQIKAYKSRSLKLKETLRRYGYSKSVINTLIEHLQKDVNL